MSGQFRDNPAANAINGVGLIDTHCKGCGDFHLASLVRRSALPAEKRVGDAQAFGAAIRQVLETKAQAGGRPFHIVLAGSTDTWLYTLVLNVAHDVGGMELARRIGVEIVDLCETPLELCRRFAAGHGLEVMTHAGDIADFEPARPADLVLMHGVLPFFPAQEQQSHVRHIASWLSETGVILCSNQHGEKTGAAELQDRIDFTLASLDRLLDRLSAEHAGRRDEYARRIGDAFALRQEYHRAFRDNDEAGVFFREAGLDMTGYRSFANAWTGDRQRARYRERVIIECTRRGAADT